MGRILNEAGKAKPSGGTYGFILSDGYIHQDFRSSDLRGAQGNAAFHSALAKEIGLGNAATAVMAKGAVRFTHNDSDLYLHLNIGHDDAVDNAVNMIRTHGHGRKINLELYHKGVTRSHQGLSPPEAIEHILSKPSTKPEAKVGSIAFARANFMEPYRKDESRADKMIQRVLAESF
jgi:hypothetical protein